MTGQKSMEVGVLMRDHLSPVGCGGHAVWTKFSVRRSNIQRLKDRKSLFCLRDGRKPVLRRAEWDETGLERLDAPVEWSSVRSVPRGY